MAECKGRDCQDGSTMGLENPPADSAAWEEPEDTLFSKVIRNVLMKGTAASIRSLMVSILYRPGMI